MNIIQKEAFISEMNVAKKLIDNRNYDKAFYHLERAHIIGQLFVIPHAVSHFYMLKLGILKKDLKEVIGQSIRVILGIIGSSIGIVPSGNTGGTNVSIFLKMEIPNDLQKVIASEKK